MTQLDLHGRPGADECLPYYLNYIGLVPAGDVLEILERQIGETSAYLARFTPEQAQRREAPKEWNALEIVGHLADTERAFSYRALRIARADAAWTRRAPAEWTLRSVRAVAYTMAGHELHHVADIRRQHPA